MNEALLLQRRGSSVLSRSTADDSLRVTIEVQNLSYFVPVAGGERQILHDVVCQFRPGELVALMGPSGAGKTTLLSCVLNNAAGRASGAILVNGTEVPQSDFKTVTKLIPQEDVLLTAFTVREVLHYQSELVLPGSMTRAAKAERILRVVRAMNLESCLDVKIGTVDSRGISGGQRKRVSIAMDLLSNPAVLCVDEPTSGLDSKTAEDVVQELRDLARGNGDVARERTIICTIHQPSYRIFALFDRVVLLTKGRIAFQGSLAELERFFDRLGLASPPKENPADHYMRLLQMEGEADRICRAFAGPAAAAAAAAAAADDLLPPAPASSSPVTWLLERLVPWRAGATQPRKPTAANGNVQASMLRRQELLAQLPRYPTSTAHQFATLFRRATWENVRDPQRFLRMFVMKVVVGLLVGTVWFKKANPPTLANLFPVEGAMFTIVLNSTIDTLAMTLLVFPSTRSLMVREYKNGSWSLAAQYPALMLSLGLFSIFYATVMILPIYFLVGLQLTAEKLAAMILITSVSTVIGNSLGVIVGACSADLIEAQSALMPMLAPMLLFSGYVVPYAQLDFVLWRFFYHISL